MQMPCVSKGAGITAGLELHYDGRFFLADASTDGRFASDVAQWTPKIVKKRRNDRSQPAQWSGESKAQGAASPLDVSASGCSASK